VAPVEGTSVTAEELIEYCQTRLADYKLPTGFEFRKDLPKSHVGKILRKVLREEELAK
jgi:long-chain acyl-CoA synthetase